MTSSMTATRAVGVRTNRLHALDGLRLVCALAVAGFHYSVSWRLDGVRLPEYHLPTASHVLIYGFLGVEMFFLISGFVIGMSAFDRTPRQYAAARIARLYPAFWACVVITAAVVTIWPVSTGVPVSGVPTVREILVNLTMLGEPAGVKLVDTVYWTLWIELRFYLLFALLVMWGLTYRRVAGFATVWLVAASAGAVLPDWTDQVIMPGYAPYFVIGLALCLMRRYGAAPWLWALVAGGWLLALPRLTARVADLRPGFPVPPAPALVILTLAVVVLTAIALGCTDHWNVRWLATAGALTYPFYLLHQRIGYTVLRHAREHTELPAWLLLAGTVLLLLGVAWLVHRYVERPLAPRLRSLVAA
ncbi:acyltransferase [Actinoplanes sp. TRM 88003]|uniref:Acyltransferase n=1 Tax=Paractinoplanes aksuensis TaxID=2939490 RepID=A0ABT1DVH5_9ACTN|nr:acyltransferase [Actinoplanes aksuensis]MCO8274862.1 acyltransferase [Actinoplanes aksuensis]